MTTLTPAFTQKKDPPALMDAQTYFALVETLVDAGYGLGKTANVAAFKFPDIEIETLTSDGASETKNVVNTNVNKGKEKAYLLIDPAHYPLPQQHAMLVGEMARNYGGKMLRERDLPDLSKAGVWVNKASAVEFDYRPVDANDKTNNIWEPNPEATRVCLTMTQPVRVPVTWDGGFEIQTGGTLAVRERDFALLAEAVRSVRVGTATVEDALYSAPGVAKIDIYGMEPGFADRQYGPVALKAGSQALRVVLAAPTQPKPQP